MRFLLLMALALWAQVAQAGPPVPDQRAAELVVTHGVRKEFPFPLDHSKILHCETAELDVTGIVRLGSDYLPRSLKDGSGLLVALYHVYDVPHSADEEGYVDLYVLLPSRKDGEGRGPRLLARHFEAWGTAAYREIPVDGSVRYRIEKKGKRVTVEFGKPITIDWGEVGRTRVAGRITVDDPHPSYRLYRAMASNLGPFGTKPEKARAALVEMVGLEMLLRIASTANAHPFYRLRAASAIAESGDQAAVRALAGLLRKASGAWHRSLIFDLGRAQERKKDSHVTGALTAACASGPLCDIGTALWVLAKTGDREEGILALLRAKDETRIGLACVEILDRGVPSDRREEVRKALPWVPDESVLVRRLTEAAGRSLRKVD